MTDEDPPPTGTVGPTSLSMLAATFTVAGTLGFASVPFFEWRSRPAPRIEWPAVLALVLIAATLLVLAYTTYKAVHRDRARIDPQRAVNLLILAKASSVVGAVVAGGYLGFGVQFVDRLDVALPRERALRALVAASAGLLIMVFALLLERACKVPKDSEE